MGKNQPNWKQFELAVASFVESIGSGAKITHDAAIPDVHTGHPRQRDVWVEWSLGGHFPAKALISCKCWAETLNEQDIDHFNGEFISSGANIGIVYSKFGFGAPALEKAKALRFHCCKLYQDDPPDLPEVLVIGIAYTFRPRFQFQVHGQAELCGFKKWHDVLALPVTGGTLLEIFAQFLDEAQLFRGPSEQWTLAREGLSRTMKVREDSKPELDVTLSVQYIKYRARVEYTLMNGSYNITHGSFLGSQATPWIDTQSVDPGPGWEEIDELDENMPKPCIVLFSPLTMQSLAEFGESEFPSRRDSA